MTAGRRRLGRWGEERAARWYREQGWRIVARNWRCAAGEVDLVVERGGVLAIVEVKTRTSSAYGPPAMAVTAAKQRRLRRLAVEFLREARGSGLRWDQIRFDVVAVLRGEVEVLEGAF